MRALVIGGKSILYNKGNAIERNSILDSVFSAFIKSLEHALNSKKKI